MILLPICVNIVPLDCFHQVINYFNLVLENSLTNETLKQLILNNRRLLSHLSYITINGMFCLALKSSILLEVSLAFGYYHCLHVSVFGEWSPLA